MHLWESKTTGEKGGRSPQPKSLAEIAEIAEIQNAAHPLGETVKQRAARYGWGGGGGPFPAESTKG